jgi:hypothetical protein
LDKYLNDSNPELMKEKLEMRMKYASPKQYRASSRTSILAMPKT